MTIWIVLTVWLIGYVVTGVITTKALTVSDKPDFEEVMMGSLVGLVWPLAVIPGAIYLLASYERKPKGLTQDELNRLDRVLMEGKEEA